MGVGHPVGSGRGSQHEATVLGENPEVVRRQNPSENVAEGLPFDLQGHPEAASLVLPHPQLFGQAALEAESDPGLDFQHPQHEQEVEVLDVHRNPLIER